LESTGKILFKALEAFSNHIVRKLVISHESPRQISLSRLEQEGRQAITELQKLLIIYVINWAGY